MFRKAPIRHILVLIDGTETSAHAVELASALASALRARLTGIAVIETETLHQLLSANVLTDAEMGDFKAGLQESGERQLEAARACAREHGVPIETVVLNGNSEVVVPQEVEARGVDLIVLGGFDSSQVRFELLFRQRQQVIDHAPCPVLVAR
jgi:nucleotide-binding universal stress UspA family protein